MSETADVPVSLAELSRLLGAGARSQGITVPVSMAVRALRDQRAINELRRALRISFKIERTGAGGGRGRDEG